MRPISPLYLPYTLESAPMTSPTKKRPRQAALPHRGRSWGRVRVRGRVGVIVRVRVRVRVRIG